MSSSKLTITELRHWARLPTDAGLSMTVTRALEGAPRERLEWMGQEPIPQFGCSLRKLDQPRAADGWPVAGDRDADAAAPGSAKVAA